MNEAYSSFSTDRRRFGVMLLLTVDRRAGPPAVDGWTLASWCCRTCVGLFMLIRPALSPWPVEGVTAWGLHPLQVPGLWSQRSSCGCLMLWAGRGSARAKG
jgi:hypothetical protein